MAVKNWISVDDVRRAARSYLPKFCFDYIEGGVDGETCLPRNAAAYGAYTLLPRYLVDISRRDLAKSLFGVPYALPFGIAPNGMAGLWRPGADLIFAQAAQQLNIPFILSGAANASLEEVSRTAPGKTAFQLYGANDRAVSEDLLKRAAAAGITTLVLTVDVPVASKRERNMRNGFGRPPKPGVKMITDALLHPAWTTTFVTRGGMPAMSNWTPYSAGKTPGEIADYFATQTPAMSQNWDDVARFRALWPHKMVLKGILHPDDARKAVAAGIDAVIVSNHGGRQLDTAPSALSMLPAVRSAVGPEYTVMIDGGISRGSDIVKALALGADFVFAGRAPIYGMAAGGLEGVLKSLDILRRELDLTLGQIGCPDIAGLNPGWCQGPG